MKLRPPIKAVLDALLAASADTRTLTLDAIGEAVGTMAITTDEIDALMTALEKAGRTIASPEKAHGEETLHVVLKAARAMRAELGRSPTAGEIAERVGLPLERVQHALALARVMAR